MRARSTARLLLFVAVASGGMIVRTAGAAAPPTPALTMAAVTAQGIRVPDPQIAVGRRYVAAIDTSTVGFYEKTTMKPVVVGHHFAFARNPVTATSLFNSLFPVIDGQMGLPATACDPANPEFGLPFDPAHPVAATRRCITEAYDTRVLYDAPRQRFWIESAIRNHLWTCTGAKHKPGVSIGAADVDPDPSNANLPKCHTEWDPAWVHRFIGIAVTEVDAAGREDLSRPFHQYTLVDDNADWPIMSVHGNMLILSHRDPGKPLAVFDAGALAKGVHDDTSMVVKPLATFPANAFKAGSTVPKSPVYLVNVHGSAKDPAYVVSTNGNSVLISGVLTGISGMPKVLAGARVVLATPLSRLRHNPVYRRGGIYLADFRCVPTPSNCAHFEARVIRIPVAMNKSRTAIVARGSGLGFIDYVLNPPKSMLSYALPVVEVDASGNMVVAFLRGRRDTSNFIPWAARYATLYFNQKVMSSSAVLHEGVWTSGSPLPVDPAGRGGIDLAGVAVDPSDDRTIWMSHAYSNRTGYTEIVGAVKPR